MLGTESRDLDYPNYESYNCTLQIRFKSRRSQSDHCSVIATDQSS